MGVVTALTCVLCNAVYQEGSTLYACTACGDLGTLRVSYDYDAVRTTMTRESLAGRSFVDQWRYLPLLPLRLQDQSVPLRVGGTPSTLCLGCDKNWDYRIYG